MPYKYFIRKFYSVYLQCMAEILHEINQGNPQTTDH